LLSYVRERTESLSQCDHNFIAITHRILVCVNHYEDTAMGTIAPKRDSQGNREKWETKEYHGKQIHVCTALRVHDNEELSGHGQQWHFKVKVTEKGAGPAAHECASAESDAGRFYSTRAITEDLAFTRGRELVEGM
jgi:hypothetical protein